MSKFNQSDAEKELGYLKKLRAGIRSDYRTGESFRKQYSTSERNTMRGRGEKIRDGLKTSGRAQPLRRKEVTFSRIKKKMGKLSAVTNTMSKISWEKDGLYFVVFMVSVIGDIGTAIIGLAEGSSAGVVALFFGMQITMFVFGISAVIFMLYLLSGHYKKKKAFIKVAVLLGFTFSEMTPIVTALPGFVGSFIINYGIVLYGRAMEESLGRRIAPRNAREYINEVMIDRLKRKNMNGRAEHFSEEVVS